MDNIDIKIMEWLKVALQLANAKIEEMKLRKELALVVLEENKPEAFSKKKELGKGFALKATQVINYKLDAIERVETVIDKLAEMGKAELARDVFKWKPELCESVYKKLSAEDKAIIDEVVSFSIGSPKLEFIEPKANNGY